MITRVPPLVIDRDDDEWPSMHQDQTWSELVYLESHLVSNEWERVVINYEVNPRIYDSGHMLIVAYSRNWDDPTAFKNLLLDYNPPQGVEPLREVFSETKLLEVLPDPSLFYLTMTLIRLETMSGLFKFTSSVTEAVDDIIHYLPIPSHLSHICTVPITEIRKMRVVSMDVDKGGIRNGRTFAFKKTGAHLEGTLTELAILDRLRDSPHIVNLEAIVVNQDDTIRGFLMLYIHASDFEELFNKTRPELGISKEERKLVFDLSLKFSWACQIAQGVSDFHLISAYNGDLNPNNVLIGSEGQAILIDFLPMGISINLEAIVVNQDDTIRGFLMLYIHASDFEELFNKTRPELGISKEERKLVFDLSLKFSWACQIAQGVSDFHLISAYNGDLNPNNVLIGSEGQAILIDFLPMGISRDFAAPEVLKKWATRTRMLTENHCYLDLQMCILLE